MPPSFKDSLPILKQVSTYFRRDGLVIDSPLFRLHHQMSALIIGIGFIFISVENYLDTKAILCHSQPSLTAYAKSYCWIHGTAYVRSSLQGKATGCFVDQAKLSSEEDAPVTAYYLWLPYLLSLLFVFTKAPHSLWKKFFESNMLAQIIGSTQKPQQLSPMQQREMDWFGGGGGGGNPFSPNVTLGMQTPKGMGGMGGGGGGGKGGKGGKGGGRGNNATTIAANFVEFRRKYARYHKKFAMFEALNIVSVFLSMLVTHWILNYKFWNYGMDVIEYVSYYGQLQGRKLHDPMCELFPTEVACNINIGSTTGALDRTNFLCILGNNLFNQKYFFVLWLWWMFLLVLSVLGLVYRTARISIPSLSRYLLSRKVHGKSLQQLERLRLSSGDCFVLEMVIDNLKGTPNLTGLVMEELDIRLTKQVEMDNSHNWTRMAEIEAGLEDGLKGDTFPLNTSGNYMHNNGPSPGGGGGDGGARHDGRPSGGHGGGHGKKGGKNNPNGGAGAGGPGGNGNSGASAPPAQDKSNSHSASTVRMNDGSEDGVPPPGGVYPDLDGRLDRSDSDELNMFIEK